MGMAVGTAAAGRVAGRVAVRAAVRPPLAGAVTARYTAEQRPGRGRVLVATTDGAPAPLVVGATRAAHLDHLGIDVIAVPDVPGALSAYRARPGIAWAEGDRRVTASSAPNDHLYPAQWSLHPAAVSPYGLDWEPVYPSVQGAGALVAVLDTGFMTGGDDQPVHIRSDLARNFVPDRTDTADDNGHGTFITNIIAEATGNSTGAAGIAPQASIVPVKVLASDGTGDLSSVARGIDYAVSIGAKVINLSLAGDQSPTLCAAVGAAARSSVVVAASGNDASAAQTSAVDFPAACPGALAVGSVAFDGSRPGYANTGCPLALVAPGGDDLNASDPTIPHSDWVVAQGYDTGAGGTGSVAGARGTVIAASIGAAGAATGASSFQYFQEEGTSMASAQVAGEAAVLIGMGADVSTTRKTMLATAHPLGRKGANTIFGAGAADIGAAVAAIHAGSHPAPPVHGYRVARADGRVDAFDPCGTADQGQVSTHLARPVVGTAATPSGLGYWLVASDGGIFSFGDASFMGSTGGTHLNRPIVGMAAAPSGHGYWLVASDGGIFSFGDAAFVGSTGAVALNAPIVGMTPTASGHGYWLVASDGGIFSFGDAAFVGSTGGTHLNQPIVGMAAAPSGHGYWLVASDGGIFSFGNAAFWGSTASLGLASPVVGMTVTSDGRGYLVASANGGVFAFGDAPYLGAATGGGAPVVGIAAQPWPGV